MAIATYLALCIDANDTARMGEFWAKALDLGMELRDDGVARLTGRTPQHTIWVNPVPEPVTVKQRVHIDVHAHAVDDVLALGATPDNMEEFPWKILKDPEGGELCVFERDVVPADRLYEINVNCAEPVELATWWADVLGGVAEDQDDSHGRWSWVEQVPGLPFEGIVFAPVPEPKQVKNRIHLDVTAHPEDLVAKGATVLREQDDEIGWTVLADPEGNEFCAFRPETTP